MFFLLPKERRGQHIQVKMVATDVNIVVNVCEMGVFISFGCPVCPNIIVGYPLDLKMWWMRVKCNANELIVPFSYSNQVLGNELYSILSNLHANYWMMWSDHDNNKTFTYLYLATQWLNQVWTQ